MSLDATTTNHRAAALTSVSALAMYDAATTTPDKLRAAAAMAEVLRRPKAAKAKPDAATTGPLTAKRLRDALKPFLAIIERRNTIPALSCVVMRSAAGRLTMSGTDLDMVYSATLDAEGLAEFCMAVPAHSLGVTLAHCTGEVAFRDSTIMPEPGATRRVGVTTTNGRGERVWGEVDEAIPPAYELTLTADGADTRIPCMDPLSVPLMNAPTGKAVGAVIPAERIVEPLKFVIPAVSTEETRYYLNGVYLEVAHEDGLMGLNFVATNGSSLHRDRSDIDLGLPLATPKVIVPLKTAKWIAANARGEVAVDIWPTAIRISANGATLLSKVIDGNFPDYRRVIPADDGKCKIAVEDPAAFKVALARVLAVSREVSRSVRLYAGDNLVKAEVRNMESGHAETFLPCYCTGNAEVSFNGRLLGEMITAPGVMHVDGPNDPAKYVFDNHPGRTVVLMPLRV